MDAKNKKGSTSFWLACSHGHLDIAILLANKGAEIDTSDNRNVTPVMAAFKKGFVQVNIFIGKSSPQLFFFQK